MQIGDLVQISPANKGYCIGIILEQGQTDHECVLVHWFSPNGLGVASFRAWEHSDKLEVISESR